ncbi:MAG: HsdR family type I site-specific deoxyribonuclease [Bacteroidia bacterium]|nr:HsdR family type I site-specific deoxyribonuclease [Bacteroidia bacterium]
MPLPSFREALISQLPALRLLMNMGWQYLTPAQALAARGGRTAGVLLEQVLRTQLTRLNTIHYRGRAYPFSEASIEKGIVDLRDLPAPDGYLQANQRLYDLLTLGSSFEERIEGDKQSYTLRYIDWQEPQNNVYHVTEEFSVLRHGRQDHYRPDIVLFVNGIPLVVIECKSPRIKTPVEKAIEQHLRNQREDGIRALYQYSALLLSLATHEAQYATTGTPKEFWSLWREMPADETQAQQEAEPLYELKHRPLPAGEQARLFEERLRPVLHHFAELDQQAQVLTEQDRALYSLCRPERLLDLIYHFTLFDDGIKKVARYQQYFAVRTTLARISQFQPNGSRRGGVIWHTQGSGKSLTMVMLAQLIANHPDIKRPRIVLVTDRIDLDDQLTDTFKKCDLPVRQATKGASAESKKWLQGDSLSTTELERLEKDQSLLALLASSEDHIITTLINKFEAAVKAAPRAFDSPDIFVLIDEGHRSQYGSFNVKMQQIFPRACFIAFTGTPLMKAEKSTAEKFGGIIGEAVYTIRQAVADGAVLPLLYEGRHHLFQVQEKPLNRYFDKVSEPLSDYGKAALKRKFSTKAMLNQADQVLYERAMDISEHFVANYQGTGLKGQLVAPNRITAIKYKAYLDEIGQVTAELVMSPPDQREGSEDAFAAIQDEVHTFWKTMMDKYGNPKTYEKSLVSAFKKKETPEILIVVDKLLTGFDAPRNSVMYLTRPLQEHGLLQAIARVNRLYPGKEYGLIIDYYGNLVQLDSAMRVYAEAHSYEPEDLEGTLTQLKEEVARLPQAHSELWDLFKPIRNSYDESAYEELLQDEALRHTFYDKLSVYARLLKLALSSLEFTESTSDAQIEKYKRDAKFFLALRVSVKRRYFDEADYREFEAQVKKLIDRHISTEGEVLHITKMVDIFDQEAREAEVERITGKAAKADHITSRTLKAITVKLDEDPVFYTQLSDMIKQTIAAYHAERISEAEFLKQAKAHEAEFFRGGTASLPAGLESKPTAKAFFNWITQELSACQGQEAATRQLAADLALRLDEIFQAHLYTGNRLLVDWQQNPDIEGQLRIALDDALFDFQVEKSISVPLSEMDVLIPEIMKVAKVRYV